MIISLKSNGKRKNFYIHRLVAEHFVKKIPGKNVVNHKDFDKKNNNYKNLEWCTQKENVRYSASNMMKPKKVSAQSSTGEKYICMRKGRYRVSITGKVDRSFKTMKDAISFRNEVLNEICISK